MKNAHILATLIALIVVVPAGVADEPTKALSRTSSRIFQASRSLR
jgi:hypothetical protein